MNRCIEFNLTFSPAFCSGCLTYCCELTHTMKSWWYPTAAFFGSGQIAGGKVMVHYATHRKLPRIVFMLQLRLLALTSKHCAGRRLVTAWTAMCFAVLVSIAASHLHLGADVNETCTVCAAVTGQLAGPSSASVAVPTLEISRWVQIVESPVPSPRVRAVVLPPSCGPPSCS